MKHPTKQQPFAIVELSSGSVGVGCGITNETGASLVWTTRLPFKGQATREYARLEHAAVSAVLEGCMALAGEGMKALAKYGAAFTHAPLVFVYGSPWSIGHVAETSRATNAFSVVTEKEVRDLIAKERTAFNTSETVRAHEERTGPAIPLDTEVVRIRAQGYPIDTLVGTSTQTFTLTMFESAIPKSLRDRCDEVARKTFTGIHTNHTSATHLFALAHHVLHPNTARCLLIEVESEITVVSYVSEGSLTSTSWFILGSRGLADEVAPSAHSQEEIRSAIELSFQSHQGAPAQETSTIYHAWTHALEETLTEVLRGVAVPTRAYLLVDEGLTDAFLRLATESLRSITKRAVHVETLANFIPHELNENGEKKAQTETMQDSGLLTLATGLSEHLKQKHV